MNCKMHPDFINVEMWNRWVLESVQHGTQVHEYSACKCTYVLLIHGLGSRNIFSQTLITFLRATKWLQANDSHTQFFQEDLTMCLKISAHSLHESEWELYLNLTKAQAELYVSLLSHLLKITSSYTRSILDLLGTYIVRKGKRWTSTCRYLPDFSTPYFLLLLL